MDKRKIILIVGNSGSGKSFAAKYLSEMWKDEGANLIVSYTTRPMRDGEVNGIDHIFTDLTEFVKHDSEGIILASTFFGAYKYWTTVNQFKGISIYVIDEEGVRYFEREFPDFAKVFKVYIATKDSVKEERGIDLNRRIRDLDRKPIPTDEYDCVICNNDCLESFKMRLNEMMSYALKYFD